MNRSNSPFEVRTAWCHAALILSKKLAIGSAQANDELKKLLLEFGSIENIYQHYFSMFPIDSDIENELNLIFSKVDFSYETITINNDNYPASLRNVKGAPPVLYCKGDLRLFNFDKSIAFVGTRELTNPLHIQSAKNAILRIAKAGYEVVVSGLATGSDTLGHITAIECGMRTIAVLGTPLNMFYPKENKNLQIKIATDNLIVTEYPVGIRSFGSFFANRNLTTVSLSKMGIIVARAGDKSGTQHAIRHCVNQHKPVYILENNIFENEYQWVKKYKDNIKLIRG
ncbi:MULTISPECIES: DNA-processing protein DprA [Serratia]|uniref:DNA-processing protein DprA n=1 Tax=Serratia TaxID=613 RepID=UPI000CE2AC47|nr:DNA-processing protein DprA [Serratia marcescens]AVD62450.1 DNA processing protein DprA [Serratia marcescens]ELL0332415.1 DNA-processing protein DprA [Serratia marcescens]MBH2548972.1 DNA-processing protein DprA [Serratia marcescens]